MADETNPQAENGNASAQAAAAQLGVQRVYIKDLSFEAPNAPLIFQEKGSADIELNMNQTVGNLAENVYEVVLTVTATAKLNDKTAYLVEVQQAGIFQIAGLDEAKLRMVVGAYCPTILFPYARQTIASLVQQGGYPPLMLQHVNFDQLYAAQLEKEGQAKSTGETTVGATE